jgi:hypothetical protein
LFSLYTFVRDLPRVRRKFRVHRPSIALATIRNETSPALQDQKSNQTNNEVRSRDLTLNSSSELGHPLLPVSVPPETQVLGPQPISEQVHVSEADPTSECPKCTERSQQPTALQDLKDHTSDVSPDQSAQTPQIEKIWHNVRLQQTLPFKF